MTPESAAKEILNWMEVFVTVDEVTRTIRGSASEGDEVGRVVGEVVGCDEGCVVG